MDATFNPIGCAVVLALLVVGLLVLRAVGRRQVDRRDARREELLPLVTAHGATASPGERLPETLPVLRSPFLTRGVPAPVLLEGSTGGSTYLLFDAHVTVSGKTEPGYNYRVVSSQGESGSSTTTTAHHTVLAWHHPGAGLPAFRILPAVDRGGFDWRQSAREAGFDPDDPAVAARAETIASTAGRWAKKLVTERETWEDLRARTGALAFPDTPGLDAAYRVLAGADDERPVRRLVDRDIAGLLEREQGLIVESAGGDWLFVALNADARAAAPPAKESPGILAPAGVDRLLQLGLHLRRRWLDGG